MMNEEQYAKIVADLASNETEHKSFKRRLDEHDESIKKQGEILIIMERQSNAIERMGKALDRVEKAVESVDSRVAELEREPGDKWKKITWEVLKYFLLAVAGLIIGYIIKGTPAS